MQKELDLVGNNLLKLEIEIKKFYCTVGVAEFRRMPFEMATGTKSRQYTKQLENQAVGSCR
jgi:hypothetical protein